MGVLDELLQALQEASGEQPQRPQRPQRVSPPPPPAKPEPAPKVRREAEAPAFQRVAPVGLSAPPALAAGSLIGQRLRDPQAVRDAMVLQTLMAPPLGLRGLRRRR